MSDDPTPTRPSELAEILDDERKFRLYVVTKLERSTAWQERHEEKDDARFASGDARMARIESNVGGVTSSVGGITEAQQQIIGAKKLFIGAIAVIGGIGASVIFFIEVAKYFFAKTP